MEEGMLDLLVQEVRAQGHKAYIATNGARVFVLGDDIIICPRVPATMGEWRLLLSDLTRAGLLWPTRKRSS